MLLMHTYLCVNNELLPAIVKFISQVIVSISLIHKFEHEYSIVGIKIYILSYLMNNIVKIIIKGRTLKKS